MLELELTLMIIYLEQTTKISKTNNNYQIRKRRKNMSFVIRDDDVLNKYNEIWDKIKETLNIRFHNVLFMMKMHKSQSKRI